MTWSGTGPNVDFSTLLCALWLCPSSEPGLKYPHYSLFVLLSSDCLKRHAALRWMAFTASETQEQRPQRYVTAWCMCRMLCRNSCEISVCVFFYVCVLNLLISFSGCVGACCVGCECEQGEKLPAVWGGGCYTYMSSSVYKINYNKFTVMSIYTVLYRVCGKSTENLSWSPKN